MDRQGPEVTVRQATAAEVLPFVLLAGGGADRALCEAVAAAGVPLLIVENGTPTFGLVLEACSGELVITAAGGRSRHFDLTAAGFALAAVQGQGFKAIRFQTRRRGLVRKAARHGYTVAGVTDGGEVFIMRKEIQ